MKIKIALILSLTLLTFNLVGQKTDFSIVSGLTEKYLVKPVVVNLIKVDDSYFMVRKLGIKGPRDFDYIIEKFDENMKFLKSIKISGVEQKRDRKIEGVFQLGQSIAIVYAIKPPKQKTAQYKMELIDPASLATKRKFVLFSFPEEIAKKEHFIDVEVSKAGKYFTISYVLREKWTDKKVIAILHFSDKGILLTNLLKSISDKTKNLNLSQTLLSDDGNVYLLLNKKKGEDEEVLDWFVYAVQGEDYKKHKIKTSILAVDKMRIAEGENGGVVGAAGFWATDINNTNNVSHFTKGVYTFKINPKTEDVTYSKVHPFSYSLVFSNWNRKYEKPFLSLCRQKIGSEFGSIKKEKDNYDNFSDFDIDSVRDMKDAIGFPNFGLKDVVETDGEILMTGGNYMYQNIAAIVYTSFSSTGNVQYDGKIGLWHNSVYVSAYHSFQQNGYPVVFFEDSYKNTDPKYLEKKPYYGGDGSVYGAVIFDGSENPKRQIACRKNKYTKIKALRYITTASDKSELLFILDVDGEGFKMARMR